MLQQLPCFHTWKVMNYYFKNWTLKALHISTNSLVIEDVLLVCVNLYKNNSSFILREWILCQISKQNQYIHNDQILVPFRIFVYQQKNMSIINTLFVTLLTSFSFCSFFFSRNIQITTHLHNVHRCFYYFLIYAYILWPVQYFWVFKSN